MARYAREGAQVHVATATRGELGALGSNAMVISREELPAVREGELRDVLKSYGVHPPTFLDYRDQELKDASPEELLSKIVAVLQQVKPDVVITFGPHGISDHTDHVTLHKAVVEAFYRYRREAQAEPKLFYVALPKEAVEQFELKLDGPEVEPTHEIDISSTVALKIAGLRSYRSQEDAQELAAMFEQMGVKSEYFHQAWPILTSTAKNGLLSEL